MELIIMISPTHHFMNNKLLFKLMKHKKNVSYQWVMSKIVLVAEDKMQA
jgi:hypothetical protein